MKMLRVPFLGEADKSSKDNSRGYWIEPSESATFFPGRGANVYFRSKDGEKAEIIGDLGIIHPEVMHKFEIPYVGSSLELNLEVFLKLSLFSLVALYFFSLDMRLLMWYM